MSERELTREQALALKVELNHYREACASVGETDGHGWAETTKELKAERDELNDRVASCQREVGEALDRNNVLHAEAADLTRKLEEATTERERLVQANEYWHVRVTQIKNELEAYRADQPY